MSDASLDRKKRATIRPCGGCAEETHTVVRTSRRFALDQRH
jgi:hypothetical protein